MLSPQLFDRFRIDLYNIELTISFEPKSNYSRGTENFPLEYGDCDEMYNCIVRFR